MKIRTGFVSNSSTSSFVILGVEVKAKDLKYIEGGRNEEDYRMYKGTKLSHNEAVDDDGQKAWIGHVISSDPDDTEGVEEDLSIAVDHATEILHRCNIDKPLKIYSVTVMS